MSDLCGPLPSLMDPTDEAIALAMLVALLSVVVAWLARGGYRRRIRRLMGFEQITPPPRAWWERRARRAIASCAPPASVSADVLEPSASRRSRRIRLATWAAYAALVVSAVASSSWLGEAPADVAVSAALAALLGLAAVRMNLFPWAPLPGYVPFMVLAFAAISVEALSVEVPSVDVDVSITDVAVVGATAAAALAIVFSRTLRPHLVPATLTVLFVVTGYWLSFGRGGKAALLWLTQAAGLCAGAPPGSAWVPLWDLGWLLAIPLGYVHQRALSGLTSVHDRGWISDISLGAAAIVLGTIAIVAGSHAQGSAVALAGTAAAQCAVVLLAYVAALGRRPPAAPSARLLVLRVFATRASAARLLDEVQTRWRFVGPVNQIGGFDLAASNLDAREASMFWTGRTHDLFLPGALSHEELEALLESAPDREGRFRVNEVFCFETAWKQTVERLIETSEAVLLDLRGFTPANQGTAFELASLAARGLLGRTVALADDRTDSEAVDAMIRRAGGDPLALPRSPVSAGADQLYRMLIRAAAGRPALHEAAGA